jgi:hypothetical protein
MTKKKKWFTRRRKGTKKEWSENYSPRSAGNAFAVFLPLARRRTMPPGRSSSRLRAFA